MEGEAGSAASHPGGRGVFGAPGSQQKMGMTNDERRRRARDSRAARVAAGAHYRRDFLDAEHWAQLAKARGYTLPYWHVPPTVNRMSAWLRKMGVDLRAYKEWSGERSLAEFAPRNPDWPLRAWIGTVLEALESGQLHSSTS